MNAAGWGDGVGFRDISEAGTGDPSWVEAKLPWTVAWLVLCGHWKFQHD